MIKIDDVTESDWNSINPFNKKIVEEFLEQSTTLSDQTLKQYKSSLQIYFFWVKKNAGDKSFYELKSRDFLFYQNWLTKMEQSSASIRFKRSAVSSFNNYVSLFYGEEYKDFRNYINKGIPLPPSNFVNEKKPLNIGEYKLLCEALEKEERWQILAYLKFSFSTGARRSEVRQLLKEVSNYEPKVLESNGSKINVYTTHKLRCKGRGKTGKIRQLNFDQEAMDSIKKWLEVRGDDDCPYVFVTKENGKYSNVGESTFNSWAENHLERLVGRRVHPHALRESRATSMVVEQGKDISSVQKLLGHASSATSEIYIIREDKDEADDAFL
jgi:integrase